MKVPDRTTAEVFPLYIGDQVLADSAMLKWPGLFARRYRFPCVADELSRAGFGSTYQYQL